MVCLVLQYVNHDQKKIVVQPYITASIKHSPAFNSPSRNIRQFKLSGVIMKHSCAEFSVVGAICQLTPIDNPHQNLKAFLGSPSRRIPVTGRGIGTPRIVPDLRRLSAAQVLTLFKNNRPVTGTTCPPPDEKKDVVLISLPREYAGCIIDGAFLAGERLKGNIIKRTGRQSVLPPPPPQRALSAPGTPLTGIGDHWSTSFRV